MGDTHELMRLILRAEKDGVFLAELEEKCENKATLFDPAHEKKAWGDLLKELNSVEE